LWVDVKTSRGYRGDYARLLIPNEDGQIPVAGRIVFRGRESKYQSFEFSVATLIEKPEQPIVLIFTTETKQGVNYVFEGHYSEDFTEKSSTTKPSLEGVIRKFFKGRELSKTVLRFIPFTILE